MDWWPYKFLPGLSLVNFSEVYLVVNPALMKTKSTLFATNFPHFCKIIAVQKIID